MLAPTNISLASAKHAFSEARHLVERGVAINFIVANHYHLLFDKVKYKENELRNGVKVKHVFAPSRWRDSPRMHFLPVGYWAWHMVKRALEEPFDIIHVFKPYYTSAIAGLLLHLISRKPIVLECDDIEGKNGWWIAHAEEPLFEFKMHLLDLFEKRLPAMADAVIANSMVLADMLRRSGVEEKRLSYIPYWIDEYMTRAGEGDRVRKKLGLSNEPVVVYCGALHSHYYDCDLLITAMKIVHEKLPRAKMIIVGHGGVMFELEYSAHRMGLLKECVIFTGWIPYREIPDYIAAGDIGVVPLRDTEFRRARGLSKVLEYLCQARPPVLPGIGQAGELTNGGKAAFFTEPGSAAALAEGIITALSNPDLCREKGLYGRNYVHNKFGWSEAMTGILEIYSSITSQKRQAGVN